MVLIHNRYRVVQFVIFYLKFLNPRGTVVGLQTSTFVSAQLLLDRVFALDIVLGLNLFFNFIFIQIINTALWINLRKKIEFGIPVHWLILNGGVFNDSTIWSDRLIFLFQNWLRYFTVGLRPYRYQFSRRFKPEWWILGTLVLIKLAIFYDICNIVGHYQFLSRWIMVFVLIMLLKVLILLNLSSVSVYLRIINRGLASNQTLLAFNITALNISIWFWLNLIKPQFGHLLLFLFLRRRVAADQIELCPLLWIVLNQLTLFQSFVLVWALWNVAILVSVYWLSAWIELNDVQRWNIILRLLFLLLLFFMDDFVKRKLHMRILLVSIVLILHIILIDRSTLTHLYLRIWLTHGIIVILTICCPLRLLNCIILFKLYVFLLYFHICLDILDLLLYSKLLWLF